MSSISGVPGGSPAAVVHAVAAQKAVQAAAPQTVRDSDGDFDGTAVGQVDAKDFGKGNQVDARA